MNGKIFLGRDKCCRRCKRGNGLSICEGKTGLENCQDMEGDGCLIFGSFKSDIAFPFVASCTIVELKMSW
ncbi:hypothetical protein Nepgr_029007 [Nepenthes gracilis]|uniref:Uncharacterized protein n=1 Tax=Nepenthes gracilis TaxID=150966 RepID=A0AAD3Y4L3_NEPGR|nr:hypothetical protein Nepgr_029007 [Nepenthes gracilis]